MMEAEKASETLDYSSILIQRVAQEVFIPSHVVKITQDMFVSLRTLKDYLILTTSNG
jgi:hypothetical protein